MRLCMCIRYCCESSLLTTSSSSFPYHFQWPAPHLTSSYHHTLCFCNSHRLHAMGSNCMEEQNAHTSHPTIVHSLSTGKWVKCHLLQLNSIHRVTGFLSHLYYHIYIIYTDKITPTYVTELQLVSQWSSLELVWWYSFFNAVMYL